MQKIVEKITNDNHKWQIITNSRKLISYKDLIFFCWYEMHILGLATKLHFYPPLLPTRLQSHFLITKLLNAIAIL
jgi:hypothetical protein